MILQLTTKKMYEIAALQKWQYSYNIMQTIGNKSKPKVQVFPKAKLFHNHMCVLYICLHYCLVSSNKYFIQSSYFF